MEIFYFSGELLYCIPYAGTRTLMPNFGLGLGPNVAVALIQGAELAKGSKVICDDLFTSFNLIDHLSSIDIGIVGALRLNRLFNLNVPSKKQGSELQPGECKSTYLDQNKLVVTWKDSGLVNLASNCVKMDPIGTCKRYSSVEEKVVDIPQPNTVKIYNAHKGGVDLLEQSASNYAISIKSNKWYWAIYNWFLQIQMVQAWRLYKKVMGKNISLLDFVRDVVEITITLHGFRVCQRPVPMVYSQVNKDVIRKDRGFHLVVKTTKSNTCALCSTKQKQKRTRFRCQRCNVGLHPECFELYHK